MSNIIPFPKRGKQSIGVRIVPSCVEFGAMEVQQFDAGAWHCRGLFFDDGEAVQFFAG
jgi:hypothetical protein